MFTHTPNQTTERTDAPPWPWHAWFFCGQELQLPLAHAEEAAWEGGGRGSTGAMLSSTNWAMSGVSQL